MLNLIDKPPDSINAEDLSSLQNQIEQHLVNILNQKWELERELIALTSASSDLEIPSNSIVTTDSASSTPTLRNKKIPKGSASNALISNFDNFRESDFLGSDDFLATSISSANSAEDSISSESSMTCSTIITGAQSEPISQGTKRSHKNSHDIPSKRIRTNAPRAGCSRPSHGKQKSKIVPAKSKNSHEASSHYKKPMYRNEVPDKFWPFVEQFCVTPSEEQIEDIKEMIEAIDNDKECYKIPALGKKETSCKDSKKSKTKANEEDASLGALTQRLVSSLIESSDEILTDVDASQPSKRKGKKQIDMKCAKDIESKIRQELEGHAILDQQDEIPYTSEDDEVLRELVACQHELLAIQRRSKCYMLKVLDRAKKHIELEAEREKMQDVSSIKKHLASARRCDELYERFD